MQAIQTRILFILTIFILCGFTSITGFAQQRDASTSTCQDGWKYRTAKLGQPASQIDFIESSVTVKTADGNGRMDAKGSYVIILNGGDQGIEWRKAGSSNWMPVGAGAQDEEGPLPIYRSASDQTPTQVNYEFRYRCNTKSNNNISAPTNSGGSSNGGSSYGSGSGSASGSASLKDAIVGCWRLFQNGDKSLQINLEFTAAGEQLPGDSFIEGKTYPVQDYVKAQKMTYVVNGNKLTTTLLAVNAKFNYEWDGKQLFPLNDEGVRSVSTHEDDSTHPIYLSKIKCGDPFER